MQTIIDIQHVSWAREQKTILSNIDWTIRPGEHWALLGLNGSGKTTLLNMITGYIWPSQGQVSVLGHRYGTVDLREMRKQIGWVSSSFQERIHPNETAQHLVISGLHASIGLYELPTEDQTWRAIELMDALGCAHLVDRRYQTCSQGEKQKLLIARALMASPRLLILDEATNGLDFISKESLLHSVGALTRQADAPSLLYVTHHIDEIIPELTHTLLLQQGRIFAGGPTREVITGEKMSELFGIPVDITWNQGRAWLSRY